MQALLSYLLNNSGIKPLRPALVRLVQHRAFMLQSFEGPDHKITLGKSGLGQG
jgi:hypothetical protein